MSLNWVWVSLYRAEYTANAADEYSTVDDEVLATVTQEYYIDHSENRIVRVITYYDDYNDKIKLVQYMRSNDASYEEAKEDYMNDTEWRWVDHRTKEVYTFYNYKP